MSSHQEDTEESENDCKHKNADGHQSDDGGDEFVLVEQFLHLRDGTHNEEGTEMCACV